MARIAIPAALWLCASNTLVTALSAQCLNPTVIPDQTMASGVHTYLDGNALKAAGVVVNGSASASFVASNCIHLAPGFRATSGSSPTTFQAWTDAVPSAVWVNPTNGEGMSQQFTFRVSSPAGHGDIRDVWVLFNTSITGTNSCYFGYGRSVNLLFLADASFTSFSPGLTPGSSATTGSFNTNCTINGAGSSVNASGNQLDLTVSITFQNAFAGPKNVYLDVYNNAGYYSWWRQLGAWNVRPPGSVNYLLTTSVFPSVPGNTISPWCPSGCQYASGTSVPISASASPGNGYAFSHFTGALAGSSPQQTIVMNGDKSVTANFTASTQQYSLTTSVNPTGAGTVSVSPPGGSYNGGTTVVVTATPISGYEFTTFSGVDSSNGSTGSVIMNANRNVTANFRSVGPLSQVITTVPAGLALTVDGTVCISPCSFQWAPGTNHTIAATTLQAGGTGTRYTFANWSDGGAASHTITAAASATYIANFMTQYYLTTAASPVAGGTISPGNWYTNGTMVQVNATANGGYQFWGFTGAATGTSVPTYFVMNAPKSVTATFLVQGTSATPNLNESALLSLFVQRHKSLVGSGGTPANGGLYGLPDTEVATVNSAVDSAYQQLDLVQTNSSYYADGEAYMNARNSVLQGMKSQLRSSVSSGSWQMLDSYLNTMLAPAMSAVSLDGNTPPQPLAQAPDRCDPAATDCLFMWSEINFYNGGGNNHGLGTRIESWVEGLGARDWTAKVHLPKLKFTPEGGSEQVQPPMQCPQCTATGGGRAGYVETVKNPGRGTYAIQGYHQFTLTYKDQTGTTRTISYPPFDPLLLYPGGQPPSPAIRHPIDPTSGLAVYETPVDLELRVDGAQMDPSGQTATVANCSAPITVTAVLTPPLPPENQAPPITWTGGTAGSDNLRRTVPCTSSPSTVSLVAALGANLQASLTVKVKPPVIRLFLPGQAQAGTERYMLTIQGANLLGTGGVPTLDFGASGITYTIETHDDVQINGWLNATNAIPGDYSVTLTPNGSSQGATATLRVVAGPGTITARYPRMGTGQTPLSGSVGIWWLGTAAIDSNDGCNPDNPVWSGGDPDCYWTWATLTVTPGTGGVPPTTVSPVAWKLTDRATNQPSTSLAIACRNSACSEISVRPVAAFFGSVSVQATLGDISSEVFIVGVDYPYEVEVYRIEDRILSLASSHPGYESHNFIRLWSKGRVPITRMPIHEQFPVVNGSPAPWTSCSGSLGWTGPIPQFDPSPNPDPTKGWAAWVTDTAGQFSNRFGEAADVVGMSCPPALGCSPGSEIPGPLKAPPQPLSTQPQAWSHQYFYVGSEDTMSLGKYISVLPRKQVRYKDHGRDELQEWSCQ